MPKPFTVTRTTRIAAPVAQVHDLLADFHAWRSWSPWDDLDPTMSRTYSGPEAGVGAGYAWEGNKKAGKGSMAITGDAPDQIDIDLSFEKPFPARNQIAFILTPAGEATDVEWRMTGELNLFMRVFSLVKPMDSLVGPDFERGLAKLKQVAEQA